MTDWDAIKSSADGCSACGDPPYALQYDPSTDKVLSSWCLKHFKEVYNK